MITRHEYKKNIKGGLVIQYITEYRFLGIVFYRKIYES